MKADKREIILDTAEKLMMKISDKEISVSLIAKEAGVGKGSIYYYFQSKEEILYAVIERAYRRAIQEYASCINNTQKAAEKIRALFFSIIKKEIQGSRKNLIRSLHLSENLMLHNYMKQVAITEITPILEKLLYQAIEEGSIYTDIPKEAAEMIVSILTFILDGTVFTEDITTYNKLKLFARVLNTCFMAEEGIFDFLYDIESLQS